MLTYEPVKPEQYALFLQILRDEARGYIDSSLEYTGMTWEQYADLFRTKGRVEGIYRDGQLAGFYWIEERAPILHLHGLILKSEFHGQGIGTQVLEMLAGAYRARMQAIELGVHRSNERAKALYERIGYATIKTYAGFGFVMQKQLRAEN